MGCDSEGRGMNKIGVFIGYKKGKLDKYKGIYRLIELVIKGELKKGRGVKID